METTEKVGVKLSGWLLTEVILTTVMVLQQFKYQGNTIVSDSGEAIVILQYCDGVAIFFHSISKCAVIHCICMPQFWLWIRPWGQVSIKQIWQQSYFSHLLLLGFTAVNSLNEQAREQGTYFLIKEKGLCTVDCLKTIETTGSYW